MAQLFRRRRSAALAATIVMFACHFANTVPLVVPSLHGMRYVSPLYLYSRSTPLSEGHMEWFALAGIRVGAVAIGVVAALCASSRDLFATYRPARWSTPADEDRRADVQTRRPVLGSLLLRIPVLRGVNDALGSAAAWGAGLVAMVVLMTVLAPSARAALLDGPDTELRRRLLEAGFLSENGILSLLVFSFLPLLVTLFAVTLAASWAHDEQAQRLELELVTPVPRWRIYLGRFIAAAATTAAVIAVCGIAILVTAWLRRADVSVSRVVGATWTLAVLGALVTAVGFTIASWRPGLTAAGTGAFIALSYFAGLVIPLLQLPGWASKISVFDLYGQPLVDGVQYGSVFALVAITLVLVPIGAARFQSRDVAR
jgi:ABC-2 type transport system permease protein